MPYYRIRIRNEDDTADDAVFTSVPGGTGPHIVAPPDGDGFAIDPIRGTVEYGSYTALIADADEGAGVRAVTSKLADPVTGRYNKLKRRVYSERGTDGVLWDVVTSGYLTGIEYPDEITAQIEFGDSGRKANTREIFAEAVGAFDVGTSIVGGPIRGGFAGQPDHGPWRMRVTAAGSGTVTLKFVSGPVPETQPNGIAPTGYIRQASGSVSTAAALLINMRAMRYVRGVPGGYEAPGLIARLEKVSTGAVTYETPLITSDEFFSGGLAVVPKLVVNSEITVKWAGTLPAVNDEFNVYVTPLEVNEENQLHIQMHPIDIQTAIWDEAGDTYDAAAAAATKAAIGPDRRWVLSIDGPWNQDAFETLLRAVEGFSYDENAAGEKVLRVVRDRSASAPAGTVAMTDMLSGDVVIFRLSEDSITNRVTFEQTIFESLTIEALTLRLDSIKATRRTDTYFVGDGDQELRFEIPGMIVDSFALGAKARTIVDPTAGITAGIAAAILDRAANGTPTGEIIVAETVTARVGEEITLTVPHQVNGNARGGSRIVQVVQRTELPDGVALGLLDVGATTQAGTVPTFTIAANPTQPKRYVNLAITNAAALAAAGYTVRISWGIGASAPSTGSLLAIVDPATTTALTTPRVDSGSHVWVRMRGEHPDLRPTAWSAWSGVDLADLTAPSSLSNPGGNAIAWTPGEGLQEVLWRPASESVNRSLGLVASSANWFDLTPYVPITTPIVATVRSKDEPPYAGVSSSATVAFTTSGVPTLSDPVNLVATDSGLGDDDLVWDDPVNPVGCYVHIERSTTSGIVGFVEIESYIDDGALHRVLGAAGTADTWYRIRYSYLGTFTNYSNVDQISR